MCRLKAGAFPLLFLCFSSAFSSPSPLVDPLIDSPGKTIGSDFNGDGIHDLIIGEVDYVDTTTNAGVSSPTAGAVFLLYGTQNLSSTYQVRGTGVDVTIRGGGQSTNSARLGSAVGSGDINADGFDDLILGSRYDNIAGTASGAVYILYGSPNLSQNYQTRGGGVDVTIMGKISPTQYGDYGEALGREASGAGDLDGDGFDDLIMGSLEHPNNGNGALYILYGSASLSATLRTGGAGVDATLMGNDSSDLLGSTRNTASSAGDVDLDGFDDIIVGAYGDDQGGTNAGAAYVFLGGASRASGTTQGGNIGLTIVGRENTADGGLGREASGAGDINGDGFDDVIAGIAQQDESGGSSTTDSGAAYIVYGTTLRERGSIEVSTHGGTLSLLGKVVSNEQFGWGAAGAGDINDDGFPDIIVGARLGDGPTSTLTDAGSAYIFFGGPSLPSQIRAGNNDVTVLGKAQSDFLGMAATGIGDINRDGIPDIGVGAYGNDDAVTSAGAAYVIFGSESLSGTIELNGTGTDITLLGKGYNASTGKFGYAVGGRMNRGP